MIYYNNSNINDWNFGDDNIIKVYKHGAVCYYKITTSGGTSGQTPCFAVVDDITQYSDTEFEDVYDKATEKWYKLNNLNQYEEYGIYGSGRTICEGSTSRLPQGYTEVEYIENTSTAYINLGVNPYSANGNSFIVESTFSSFTQSSLAYLISTEYTNSPYYGFILRWANNNLQLDGGSIGIDTTATNIPNGDGTSAITFYSYSTTTSNNNTPITLFCGLNGSSPWRNGKGKCYSFKLTINNNIVRDLVPCKRDSDDKYGMYDIVNDVFYVSPNNIDFSGGEPITPTDCVTTYEGKLTIDDGDDGEDYSTHYLTLVAQTDNVTFSYSTATSGNKLQYSVDSGSTWNDLSNGSSTSPINNGDKIMFKASGLTVNTERGIGKIIPSASASVEGNIMSLEYGDNFSGQTTIQNNYQFRKLFSGVTTITSAENMVLPATTLKQQCYSQMFQGCTNLVKTPKTIGSSAMIWSGSYCFSNMFSYCTSLTTVPSGLLPALNLGSQCYWYMFEGCSGLTTAPDLPATTTASQCYQGMFINCSSLNYITVLTTNNFTMNDWLSGVAASGTFVKNPNATWSSCGQNAYPCGWTVQDYVEPTPIKYEYIYSGGSWINLGEVSGSTQIIKSPEYIEKDSSHNGRINLDYVWKTNSKMQFKFYSTNNGGGAMIGEDGMPDNNDCRMFFASTIAYFDWGSSRISWSSNGRTNTLYEYEYGNYYIKNMVTSASKTGSTISTSRTNPLYLGQGGSDRFRTYYIKFYDGDTLVKDFIPWTDMNGNYGLFDKVSLSVYNVSSGSLTGSSNVTDVEVGGGGYEYPLEYPVIQDPPDNLVFSSMAEAESYECPWVGMRATIDGDKYIFSGDSQSGYEWVYNPSRLPVGYTEVEYIENTGTSYINTDLQIYSSTTNSFEVGAKLIASKHDSSTYQNVFSCMSEDGEPYQGFTYRYSRSSLEELSLPSGQNTFTVVNNPDSTQTVTVTSSTSQRTYTHTYPLTLFCGLNSSRNPFRWTNSKFYYCKIRMNDVLVRDLVPCKRDSDDKYGMYDIVNDTFYLSPNNVDFIGGDPV